MLRIDVTRKLTKGERMGWKKILSLIAVIAGVNMLMFTAFFLMIMWKAGLNVGYIFALVVIVLGFVLLTIGAKFINDSK